MDLSRQPVLAVPKTAQVTSRRIKPTQRQMGAISAKVRDEVKDRTMSHCELRKPKCTWVATHMAHITGRKQLNHVTTADDILHVCVPCHRWLDETPEGIRYKRELRERESG